jgi:hypothetical protein
MNKTIFIFIFGLLAIFTVVPVAYAYDEYATDQYPTFEPAQYDVYPAYEPSANWYPTNEYARNMYPNYQYANDTYPTNESATDIYPTYEYANDAYPTYELARDQYPIDEYASDLYPINERAADLYPDGNSAPWLNSDTDPYRNNGVYTRDIGYPVGGSGDIYSSDCCSFDQYPYPTYTYQNPSPLYPMNYYGTGYSAPTPNYGGKYSPTISAPHVSTTNNNVNNNTNVNNIVNNNNSSATAIATVASVAQAVPQYPTAYAQPLQAYSQPAYIEPYAYQPVAYIPPVPSTQFLSLSQLPYTGVSTGQQMLTWLSIVVFALAAAYLLAYNTIFRKLSLA